MTHRMKSIKNLIKSKCYILITDKEAEMAGDFRGFTGLMKIHALMDMQRNLDGLVKRLKGKEAKNGRNKPRRKASGRDEQK